MSTANIRIIEQLGQMELAVSRLYRAFAERFPDEREIWDALADEEEQHHQWVMILLESAKAGKVRVKDDARVSADAVRGAIERVEELMGRAIRGDMDLYEAFLTAYALETSLTEGKAFSLLESSSSPGQPSVCEDLDSATSAHALRLKLRITDLFGEKSLEDAAGILGSAGTAPKFEVAACGLLCSSCRKYLARKCPGCARNEKAGWCKVRICVTENGYATCAECSAYPDPDKCPKFNNFFSKIFGFLFDSDRGACIRQIKKIGVEAHARELDKIRRHTLPRS